MKKSDLEAAMRIKQAEGWNQTIQDWNLLYSDNPELCLVAYIDQEVIATVTAISYEKQLAWIGMMLVRKEYQGMGIGKLLMKSILTKLEAFPSIKLDATPAGFPLYAKLGFIEEYRINRMTRPAGSKPIPVKQGQLIRPSSPKDLQNIVDFDREIFRVNREAVIKHLLNNSRDSSWISEDGDKISGYLLGRPGSNFFQLGPLISKATETSIGLLSHALALLQDQPIVVDVLQDKENLIKWLQDQGFTQQRELIRMYYRHNPNPGIIPLQYLISGPELG